MNPFLLPNNSILQRSANFLQLARVMSLPVHLRLNLGLSIRPIQGQLYNTIIRISPRAECLTALDHGDDGDGEIHPHGVEVGEAEEGQHGEDVARLQKSCEMGINVRFNLC